MSKRLEKCKVEDSVYEYFLDSITSNEKEVEVEDRGFILRCLRRSRGVSQKELADELGTTFCTINRYESGRYKIPDLVWYGFLYYFRKEKENDI